MKKLRPPKIRPTNNVEILATVRRVIDRTSLLKGLTDAQAVEFYKKFRQMHVARTYGAYAKISKLLVSWGVFPPDTRFKTIVKSVTRCCQQWFDTTTSNEEHKREIQETRREIQATRKEMAVVEKVSDTLISTVEKKAGALKEQIKAFDPIKEAIALYRSGDEELQHWENKAREDGVANMYCQKLRHTQRETLKDIFEDFQRLELLDKDVIDKIQSQVSIGSIQLLVQNKESESSSRLGGFLGDFIGKIPELLPQLIGSDVETELCPTDIEPGTGPAIDAEFSQDSEFDPFGISDSGGIPPEFAPGNDESD